MKSRNILVLTLVAVLTLLLGTMQPAQALFKMRLTSSDGGSVTITDNAGSDLNGVAGLMLYSGGVGSNFLVNVTIGSSKPFLGSATQPTLNITSLNANSLAAGALTIELTNTDFGPLGPNSGFVTTLNSTLAPGTVAAQSWIDNSNGEFGQGIQVGNILPQGPGAFNAADSGIASPANPFSMTLISTITHSAGGQTTTFDATVATPEPGTLALVGSGLVFAYGFIRRKRKKYST